MKLDPDDFELSMKISRRARDDVGNQFLRSLLIHRLTTTLKAVLRRPLKPGGGLGLYCEACDLWQSMVQVPTFAACAGCGRRYRVELVIYEEIEDD